MSELIEKVELSVSALQMVLTDFYIETTSSFTLEQKNFFKDLDSNFSVYIRKYTNTNKYFLSQNSAIKPIEVKKEDVLYSFLNKKWDSDIVPKAKSRELHKQNDLTISSEDFNFDPEEAEKIHSSTIAVVSANNINKSSCYISPGYHSPNNISIGNISFDEKTVEILKEMAEKEKNKKGEEKMNNKKNQIFKNCEGLDIRLSNYGIAVKNMAGAYVSYDPKTGSIVDVSNFCFKAGKYIYTMPAAIKDLKAGDVIVHTTGVPVYITNPLPDSLGFDAIDIINGEEKIIIPTKNMFGFDFVNKLVPLFDTSAVSPSEDLPFGNMFPLMMMEDGDDLDPMMLMLAMNGGQNLNCGNPMLMYAMMRDKGQGNDLLPLMMMINNK